MRTLLLLIAIATSCHLLAGCDEPGSAHATSTPPQPVTTAPPASTPVAAPPAASPAVPSGDLAGFAPDAVLAVRFKEINDRGYPIVILTNLTGRDIDDIRGGFRLKDAEGTILHATGLTIAVPGDLFIAADSEKESSPFGLNRKTELMDRLRNAPDELSFSFEAQDVTFMD